MNDSQPSSSPIICHWVNGKSFCWSTTSNFKFYLAVCQLKERRIFLTLSFILSDMLTVRWQIISTRYKAHFLMWWLSLMIPSDISNRVSVRRQPFKVVSLELDKKACCPELSWSRISKCVGFSPRYQFHSTHVLALKLATGWHLIAAQYYNSLS